jgi:hypothetical protein
MRDSTGTFTIYKYEKVICKIIKKCNGCVSDILKNNTEA